MARVSRLAGAMLLEADARPGEPAEWFLIGNTKEPCDFPEHGFRRPPSLDAEPQPVSPLDVIGVPRHAGTVVVLPARGRAGAEHLAERMLIARNLSVSDRLWRLVVSPDEPDLPPPQPEVEARWLMEVPGAVWEVVRDTVLRCL